MSDLLLQSKLHPNASVKFVIRLDWSWTVIGLCWASTSGHGSSSVRALLVRSIDDSDDRFADTSNTPSSIDEMEFLANVSVFS